MRKAGGGWTRGPAGASLYGGAAGLGACSTRTSQGVAPGEAATADEYAAA